MQSRERASWQLLGLGASVYGIAPSGPGFESFHPLLFVHLYNKRTQENAVVLMMVQEQEEFSL